MSKVNVAVKISPVKCICGTEPVIEIKSVAPVSVDFQFIQHVHCPNCLNAVSGAKGIKMWNALMRTIVRTNKSAEQQRKRKRGELK